MDFINKLIKKGIFGLILMFSFFVFGNEINVKAAACTIELNDGNDYLVVNSALDWRDSGVTAKCDSVINNNVTVKINNGTPIATTNSANGAVHGLNVGFYKIKYYLTSDETVSVTRQIRVLPNSLNDANNFWLGEGNKIGTTSDDTFNKIIDINIGRVGYIAVGDFSNVGYITAFNLRGEYLWHESLGGTADIVSLKINDIIPVGTADATKTLFYIAGEYTDNSNSTQAFLKRIQIATDGESIPSMDNSLYSVVDSEKEYTMTSISKITVAGEYVVAAGYVANEDGTKTGKLVRFGVSGGNFVSPKAVSYQNAEYNYLITVSELVTGTTNTYANKVIAVGSVGVSGYSGATGGSIVKCDVDTFTCTAQTPYYYLNNNMATTTMTGFNSIVSHGTGYIVVGQSRVDKVEGISTSNNRGVEDMMIVLLDNSFKVLDVKLTGTAERDELLNVKKISENKFVAVGNQGAYGYYVIIDNSDDKISMSEKRFSGTTTILKDVIAKELSDEEKQYVFIGSTSATSIEGVIVENKGLQDAMIAMIDDTSYSNYSDIAEYQNAIICEDGTSVSCAVENLKTAYDLKYGTKGISFSNGAVEQIVVSSEEVKVYSLYHGFKNTQGVMIMIGRKIRIVANLTAPDLSTDYDGIVKWYEYNRTEKTDGEGNRKAETWKEYFYPVDNHLEKEEGVAYYVFSQTEKKFIVDSSEGETYLNYILLSDEKAQTRVAFQSYEKAVEYSLIQEYARIALVKEKYEVNSYGSIAFEGDQIELGDQGYYFIYYADMDFGGNTSCKLANRQLTGACTNAEGYAFSNLRDIKNIIEKVIEKNNYFVSEKQEKFVYNNTNVLLPEIDGEFYEEMFTIKFVKEKSFTLEEGITLDVKYYAPNGSSVLGYDGFLTESEDDYISGQAKAVFGSSGDFSKEGKYVVRKCYNYGMNNQVCGKESVFVLDTTAPIANYNLFGGGVGQMTAPAEATTEIFRQKTTTTVTSITDIDPYAYTIYEGKRYYLVCNNIIKSALCSEDLKIAVKRTFEYDKENPNKVFNLEAYDRAGNGLNISFIVGTANPTISIDDEDTTDNSFELNIDFFEKNNIIDVGVSFAKMKEDAVVETKEIEDALLYYIRALMDYNRQEWEKERATAEDEEPYKPKYIKRLCNTWSTEAGDECKLLTFSYTGDGKGLSIPIVEYDGETGNYFFEKDEEGNYTNAYKDFNIEKGLYKITIVDSFNNRLSVYGGVGIKKSAMNIYEENDEEYEEYIVKDGVLVNRYEAGLAGHPVPVLKQQAELPKDEVEEPKDEEENIETEASSTEKLTFDAVKPSTYKYFEYLPVSLHGDFDETMLFSGKFIYVKFAITSFGGLTINKASNLNKVGSFDDGLTKHLTCVFGFYGSSISGDVSGLTTCKNKYLFSDINKDEVKQKLAAEGIYFVGSMIENEEVETDGNVVTEQVTYYYMAFTKDGTYNISNDMYPNFQGIPFGNLNVPIEYSFSIDTTTPNIEFSVVCNADDAKCKGDKPAYNDINDFVFEKGSKTLTNIGNNDMKLILNKDVFTYVDALGNTKTIDNRLVVVKIDDKYYNAYDYSIKNSDTEEGNYILFSASGTYEISFYDAGQNEIIYRFVIDKNPPVIGEMIEINGKDYENSYQKDVDIRMSIKEDSFASLTMFETSISDKDTNTEEYADYTSLDVCNGNMKCILYRMYVDSGKFDNETYKFYTNNSGEYVLLGSGDTIDPAKKYYYSSNENIVLIEFWTSEDAVKRQIGIIRTNDGGCAIGSGSGYVSNSKCEVIENGDGSTELMVSFTIAINKGENPKSDIQVFTIKATDYFGNEDKTSQTFYFDNLNPYIFFNGYVPTTKFGEENIDKYKDVWLSIDGNTTSGTFNSCDKDIFGRGAIITCKDTPINTGKDNGVSIETFEAERVAYNNFIGKNDGSFESIENGIKVDAGIQLYKGVFEGFKSRSDLERATLIGLKVYEKGNQYVLMENYDYIDPIQTYYYDDNGNMKSVSIKNMYTDSAFDDYTKIDTCGSNKTCILYRMYIDEGKFTNLTNRFYILETNEYYIPVESVSNYDNYSQYYYASDYVTDYGKYLPALTLANSCVLVKGTTICEPVVKGRVKLQDENHTYYNVISTAAGETASITNITMKDTIEVEVEGENGQITIEKQEVEVTRKGIIDNRIWQIAVDEYGREVKFGVGITSEFGRPIIFRAKDGAGNISSNSIETIIKIEDNISPNVQKVQTLSFVKDESSTTTTKDNYVLKTTYAKVPKKTTICEANKYYKYTGIDYVKVESCAEWDSETQYYVPIQSYEKVQDGLPKDTGTTIYYVIANNEDVYDKEIDGESFNDVVVTEKDFIITFDEPINKIECSYYLYNSTTGEQKTEKCSFDGTVYDYREEKMTFKLVYENTKLNNYYVHYYIVAYDISGNSITVNTLFSDREKPVLEFNSETSDTHFIEVNYRDNNYETKYNLSYISDNFHNEVNSIDNVNTRIQSVGGNYREINPLSYEIVYKKFNFNKTYLNYVKDGTTFKSVENGKDKINGITYYILVEDTGEYVLKGNSGTCSDGYCYIEDDRNYYPSLLKNDLYWTTVLKVGEDEVSYIPNNELGVYKIEYQATDKSGNISEMIYKTIYITDTTAPKLKLNGEESSAKTGEHNKVTISFENEKDSILYKYTCASGLSQCAVPTEIFTPGNFELSLSVEKITSNYSKVFDSPGMYKFYLHDSGNYQQANIKWAGYTNGETVQDATSEAIMSLKYNYIEYQFRIDQTPPDFSITANIDGTTKKMYYELILNGDEPLYCIVENRMTTISEFNQNISRLCQNGISVDRTSMEEKTENGIEVVVLSSYNAKNELVYERKYEKVGTGQKYFYYTYYKKTQNGFEPYSIGAAELEDNTNENVYRITMVKIRFTEDGTYAVRAMDAAGNMAARDYEMKKADPQLLPTFSTFTVDNTAPTYNQSQNTPTGGNYWFSVPSAVIKEGNDGNINYMTAIGTRGLVNGSYNILESNLNNNFFYAFATKEEAKNYLIRIYTNHINAQSNGSCATGVGFNYTYYNPATGSMASQCFVDTLGINHKGAAISEMIKLFDSMIYKTFSGNLLFGNSEIRQTVCESSDCSQNIYKYVYLQKTYATNGTESNFIAETCVNEFYGNGSPKVECIKVKVKIVKVGFKTSFVLGTSNIVDPDSQSMTIYSKQKDSSTYSEKLLSSQTDITLNNNTYYIFEETDKVVDYPNSDATNGKFSHYNVSYYAIYVDNNEYLDVHYQDDKSEGKLNIVEGNVGILTNHNRYDLIIKEEKDPKDLVASHKNFMEKYEIFETRDENEYILEVYSYLRLMINGSYYNLNNYFVGIYDDVEIEGKKVSVLVDYYYRIPIVNIELDAMKERLAEIHILDRVGNDTFVKVSHSQTPPSIQVAYSGTGKDQVVKLEIRDNRLTTLDTDSIEVYFSKDRNNYSNLLTENIKHSLLCASGTSGYKYGCINVGTINSVNSYAVNISNLEGLLGFFKVEARDDHGNYSVIEFLYNPADTYANYTSNVKYITSELNIGQKRIITKENLSLEWNNELNYVVLYKEVKSGDTSTFVEVCNSKNAGTNNVECGDKSNKNNYIKAQFNEGRYEKSILYFEDEGLYKAEIVNRASTVINTVCINDDGVIEDCKKIKTSTNNGCNWTTNSDICKGAFEIITKDIIKTRSVGTATEEYYLLEIDKTKPTYNEEKDFIINLPAGSDVFENGKEYTNGSVVVNWYEPGVSLIYSCEYLNPISENDRCQGGTINYNSANKGQDSEGNVVAKKILGADISRSARYTFYFEDYVGNSTETTLLSFTINIILPEIEVYEVDNGGQIIANSKLESDQKVKNNVKLVCYEEDSEVDCNKYYIELYKNNSLILDSKNNPLKLKDIMNVVEPSESESDYMYIVYVKSLDGGMYNRNLQAKFEFTIDKKSPTITIIGNKENDYGFYKGNVQIQTDGTGTIYSGCVTTGEDSDGSKKYACNDDPYVESFNSNYTLNNETGVFKIVSVDEIGNITTGSKVKYITIDNQKPTVSIVAKTPYLTEGYALAENGFTNAESVTVKALDNNDGTKILYCTKTDENECQWQELSAQETTFTQEGYYKVKVTDAVGNQSMERSFKIYRQKPTFALYYSSGAVPVGPNDTNKIFTESMFVSWTEPTSELIAPIVKVTLNGKSYQDREVISETGEYVFVFVDLAGNTSTYRLNINKSSKICLDGVCLTPNVYYDMQTVEEIIYLGKDKDYTFKKDDVFIFASKTNSYGQGEECLGLFNYKSLFNREAYYVLSEEMSQKINSANAPIAVMKLTAELQEVIKQLNGDYYLIVVDLDVAKNDLGFKIGENFFTKDPLGWSLIFIAGIGLIYASLKLVIFKKKVRVLK